MRKPFPLESHRELESLTYSEWMLLNPSALFEGHCLYFLSECSPFTFHLVLFRTLGGGLKESKEGFVLQKESKESSLSLVMNKIIKMDCSIPLPLRLVPTSEKEKKEKPRKFRVTCGSLG